MPRQAAWNNIEPQISAARRAYHAAGVNNNACQQLPKNMLADDELFTHNPYRNSERRKETYLRLGFVQKLNPICQPK